MPVHLTILGSGSSGNAGLLDVDGFGLLIDAGLGPRQIAARLKSIDASWDDIHATILTHTHADHWQDATFAQLCRREIRLHCHPSHVNHLIRLSPAFCNLRTAGLVRTYDGNSPIPICDNIVARPVRLSHDSGATFGFRIERERGLFGQAFAVAYAADLGMWTKQVIDSLVDADVLALEFNHDVGLQRASGRPPHLIARVLGNEGHLSNEQAGELVESVLKRSTRNCVKSIVQLHLSRQCNRVELARTAARKALHANSHRATLLTADHQTPVRVAVTD